MQLVQLAVTLRFDELTQLRTPARKVYAAFGGVTPKTKPQEPGASIRGERQKLLVNWRYDRCRIALERTEDRNECVTLIVQSLETINAVAPIGKIQNMDVSTSWILRAPRHNFDSLNELYVQTMLSPREFVQGTCDSSIILDSRTNEFVLHSQSGPMASEQLLGDFLVYRRANLPKVFMFLLASIGYTKVIDYSEKEIHRLVQDAFYQCERHSEDFGRIWEGNV